MITGQKLANTANLALALLALTGCTSPISITQQASDATSLISACGGGTIAVNDRSDFVLMDLSGSMTDSFPARGMIGISSFSTDGRFLIYTDINYGLFILDTRTRKIERFDLKVKGFPFHPAWSYNGQQLAFAVGSPDENGYTYIVNIDTPSSAVPLPHAEHSDFEEPESWRKNGDLLLSVRGHINKSYPIGKVHFSELVVVNTISGERRVIYTSESYIVTGKWSPDGQWIVVTEGNPRVTFLLDWQNNTKKALEKIPLDSKDSVWSPNGKCIAFLDPLNYIQVYLLDVNKAIKLSAVGGYYALAWGK